jgi:transposase-like protein
VRERAQRRRFTADYKMQILQEAQRCTEPGQLGALLRREGLYSSHLTTWRQQRDAGAFAALVPKPRGRKARPANPLGDEHQRLTRENQRLAEKLRRAELIIDVQKKLCEALGISPPPQSESPA